MFCFSDGVCFSFNFVVVGVVICLGGRSMDRASKKVADRANSQAFTVLRPPKKLT